MFKVARLAPLLLLASLGACRCAEPLTSECSNGEVKSCTCDDGSSGLAACVNAFFTDCVCEATDAGPAGEGEGEGEGGEGEGGEGEGEGEGEPDAISAVQVKIPSGSGAASSDRFRARVRIGAPPGNPSPRSP